MGFDSLADIEAVIMSLLLAPPKIPGQHVGKRSNVALIDHYLF
jgi:hypothetical protein